MVRTDRPLKKRTYWPSSTTQKAQQDPVGDRRDLRPARLKVECLWLGDKLFNNSHPHNFIAFPWISVEAREVV